MAQYEENQIEFAILSLVKDPLVDLLSDLAENVNGLMATLSQLDEIQHDWASFIDNSNGQDKAEFLKGADAGLGLTEEHISKARAMQENEHQRPLESATAGLRKRNELIVAQQCLRIAIQEENQSVGLEQARARARNSDFGVKMQKFARSVQAKKAC